MRNLALTMSALAGIGIGGLAVGIGTSTPAFAHVTAGPGEIEACPDRLPSDTSSLTCGCPGSATTTGSVWGTDIYSDDSYICPAALHAGAIGRSGGVVTVNAARGQDAYGGTLRNGITSSNWGAWRRSITFARDGSGPIVETSSECPANAVGLQVGATCRCTPEAANANITVWGSGPYTADSNICTAARHAGAIGADGGYVSFTIEPGRGAYPASTRNGVTTIRWASYDRSFAFRQ